MINTPHTSSGSELMITCVNTTRIRWIDCEYTRSLTTFKPLTDEVNNIVHFNLTVEVLARGPRDGHVMAAAGAAAFRMLRH